MLLKKKIFQIGSVITIFLVGGLFVVNTVLAQVPPVDPNANDLIVNFTPNPLFNADNFLPGDSKTGEVEVINNTTETKRIATEAINYPEGILADDLSRALTIIIKYKDGSDIYGGSSSTEVKTLYDFYKNGETYLSDVLGNGNIKEYEFVISFPVDKGDEWQGKTTSFDIIVGFQEEDGNGIITPPSGGGGGSVPGLIIKNEGVVTTTEFTATIEWWTSYNATSRVIYCKTIENCDLDLNDDSDTPPLYGYYYTTDEEHSPANENGVTYRKITITGLQKNTTYSYRAISHASPPTISRTHTFTTLAIGDDENGSTQENGANDEGENGVSDVSTQENGANENEDNEGSTQENGVSEVSTQENGANENDNNPEKSGLIPSVNKAFNSANNFIGSVLGLKSVNEVEEDNIRLEQGGEIRDSYKGNHTSALLAIVLLFLLIIILLYRIYHLSRRTKKET
ncbi:MAG: fibronectin type III domain-containing protein [Patescibacteria group bacterium]|nr:fibronectin type III domain-containing protein [Patescibacteria group bacterium]